MTRKLSHPNFELDLSIYKISVVRENHWFSEDFFTKISFPFDLELTDKLDQILGFISRHNTTAKNTLIHCKYYHNDTVEDAIFEVEQLMEKLSGNLEFGFDQLPNWEKKLSELPLQKFELAPGTDIYAHAETIITQTWPAVNYNFPQIHTDKIDPDNDDVFFAFEKIINNRKAGAFLINEVITEGAEEVTYNRNIMQPLPYWLHVLKAGFLDANLILAGDILNDVSFKKKVLFADVEYYTTVTQESISIIQLSEDKVEVDTISQQQSDGSFRSFTFFRYATSVNIPNPGRYRIIGKIRMYGIPGNVIYVRIKYRNQVIFDTSYYQIAPTGSIGVTRTVNVVFDTLADLLANDITVESWQANSVDQVIIDLNINPIRLHDFEGNPIPNIINKNEIDLTKSVPDMTFGDFVKVVKNWYNYDLNIVGDLAVMNLVENQINYNNAVDLSHTEVRYPSRKFKKGISFLLKFQDVETKDFTFPVVFQNVNGIVNSSYVTNDKTNTIEINALPLPLFFRNNVQTAYAFESNSSKAYAVLYDGLTAGNNIAKDPFEISLPEVHKRGWYRWFLLRINGEEYAWPFSAFAEKLLKLKPTSKIFAYGKYHVVKSINDVEVSPGVFDIEIETVTLE